MRKIAIIGGTYLNFLQGLHITHRTQVNTPYGEPSAALNYGLIGDAEVVFLPRRGDKEQPIPPHLINYRANIWALRDAGVEIILSLHAAASIDPEYQPGNIVLADQLIDYTYARGNTFFDLENLNTFVGFADPFDISVQSELNSCCERLQIESKNRATIAVTQGPRLETKAELNKMHRDGAHLVNMTAMPEPCLAKELDLKYGCIALVSRLAGTSDIPEKENLNKQAEQVEKLVYDFISRN